jgi:hypothetical protein
MSSDRQTKLSVMMNSCQSFCKSPLFKLRTLWHCQYQNYTCVASITGWLMNVEQLGEWDLAREATIFRESPPLYHFVHHKSHMTWPGIEAGLPQWEAGDQPSCDRIFKTIELISAEPRISEINCILLRRSLFMHIFNQNWQVHQKMLTKIITVTLHLLKKSVSIY